MLKQELTTLMKTEELLQTAECGLCTI